MKILNVIIIILILFLIILGILDYFIPENCFFQDYTRGIFTETIGIIITIILIEFLLEKHRKLEEEKIIRKEIKRAYDLLEIYLTEYDISAFYLINKSEDISNQTNMRLETDFSFNNLSEIFIPLPTLDNLGKTKIENYFEKLDNLKEIIKTIILKSDLSRHPKFSSLLFDFMKFNEKNYPKNSILIILRNEEIRTTVTNLIENYSGEVQYQETNIINNYIRLYEIINYNIEFSSKVKKTIDE